MERDGRLIGAYGKDRKEFLRYRSSLAQAEKQSKVHEESQRLKDFARRSPLLPRHSESPQVNQSYTPVSHFELSYQVAQNRQSIRFSPHFEGTGKEATLEDYNWTVEDDRSPAYSPIAGKSGNRGRLGGKIMAVLDQHAEYYEQELKKELQIETESTARRETLVTPLHTPDLQIHLGQKNRLFSRMRKRERSSEVRMSVERDRTPLRDSVERNLQPTSLSKKLYKVAVPPGRPSQRLQINSLLDSEVRERREQQLEESIQELDELLLRIKKRHNQRSNSVMRDAKSKSFATAKRRIVPRLKLPGLVA